MEVCRYACKRKVPPLRALIIYWWSATRRPTVSESRIYSFAVYIYTVCRYTPTLVPTELCRISENYAISHAIVDRETAFVKQRLELRTTTKFLAFHQRIRHFEYFRAVCCFPLKKKWLSFISLRELYHVFVGCQACDRRCFWILISCLIMLITSINCWAPFTTTNRHPVWILSAGDDNNNMSKDNM